MIASGRSRVQRGTEVQRFGPVDELLNPSPGVADLALPVGTHWHSQTIDLANAAFKQHTSKPHCE